MPAPVNPWMTLYVTFPLVCWLKRTVLGVAGGIEEWDFEPRPSHEICSWCDYRLICPASEA